MFLEETNFWDWSEEKTEQVNSIPTRFVVQVTDFISWKKVDIQILMPYNYKSVTSFNYLNLQTVRDEMVRGIRWSKSKMITSLMKDIWEIIHAIFGS